MNTDRHRLNQITERVIGCAYAVANTLGHGFVEKVYENALAYELRRAGMAVEQQKGIKVLYDGDVVGEYVADL
ncbi:MAG: GxxExxY protein, partial [Nitrospinae bacterium]|nr:GxxExxY protein [Nitrospinota bacterium]